MKLYLKKNSSSTHFFFLVILFRECRVVNNGNQSLVQYRTDFIDLSWKYIKALPETQNVGFEDPYTTELMGYDFMFSLYILHDGKGSILQNEYILCFYLILF